ncbi:hypothetical protein MLD52_22385 [Puniceicoccaceae bacterium K14]|nr:hypothetical protein [Puniceicoccaceae bacterium K14]
MALLNYKTEGGQGGKRGHSNMEHWDYTEAIKEATRRRRRSQSKRIVESEFEEYINEEEFEVIYISLLDEGTAVWRPVLASPIRENVYLISDENTIPESEKWEFLPSDEVLCEGRAFEDQGKALVAIKKINTEQ